MNKITLALVAVMLAAPSVHAAELNCNRPLSEAGYQTLSNYWYYTQNDENRSQIDGTMQGFCEMGKKWRREGIPEMEVQARLQRESQAWVQSVLAERIAVPETLNGFAAFIYLAGYSGYTNVYWPPVKKRSARDIATDEKDLEDLFGDLSGKGHASRSGAGQQNKAAPKNIDVSGYIRDMQVAIRGNLPDWGSYQGKTCMVRVNLTRDAMLMGASTEGGDPAFCAAMLKALQTVKFPKFPNDDVYSVFKNAVIDFKP